MLRSRPDPRTFSVVNVATFLIYAALSAVMFFLVLHL